MVRSTPPSMRAISSDPLGLVQGGDRRTGFAAAAFLVHEQVLVAWAATCGKWVTVRTWPRSPRRRSNCPTTSAVGPPMPTSTSSKTRGGDARGLCRDHLDRQADPRQFAARGDLGQPFQRLPGVGADQELHAFQSVGLRLGAVAGMQDDGEAPPGMPRRCISCSTLAARGAAAAWRRRLSSSAFPGNAGRRRPARRPGVRPLRRRRSAPPVRRTGAAAGRPVRRAGPGACAPGSK